MLSGKKKKKKKIERKSSTDVVQRQREKIYPIAETSIATRKDTCRNPKAYTIRRPQQQVDIFLSTRYCGYKL